MPVPHAMRVENGYLIWDQTGPKYVAPKPTLLENFLNIRIDSDVAEFAARWGALGSCSEHEVPNCDHGLCCPDQINSDPHFKGPAWREPLEAWHRMVNRANALLRIGRSIQSDGSGSKADWLILILEEPPRLSSRSAEHWLTQPWRSIRSARTRFQWEMQKWIDIGDIRTTFIWQDRWAIRSSVPSSEWPLFGHVALLIATTIAGGGMQSELCYFCRREYWPQRRPSPGQLNCCGDQECKRDYWRQNKRDKKLRDGSK